MNTLGDQLHWTLLAIFSCRLFTSKQYLWVLAPFTSLYTAYPINWSKYFNYLLNHINLQAHNSSSSKDTNLTIYSYSHHCFLRQSTLNIFGYFIWFIYFRMPMDWLENGSHNEEKKNCNGIHKTCTFYNHQLRKNWYLKAFIFIFLNFCRFLNPLIFIFFLEILNSFISIFFLEIFELIHFHLFFWYFWTHSFSSFFWDF
jgi:hypothetical protein